jgi:Spy/CpxP family protein refolding chaperone
MLLTQKSVQEELKLSEDQVKKVQDYVAKAREDFRGLRDLKEEERKQKFEELAKKGNQFLADTLKPEQAKRLKQITIQIEPLRAAHDPEVAKDLGLTEEQKTKIKDISEDTRKQAGEVFRGEGSREEKAGKIKELRKGARDKFTEVLTPEQRTKWKELAGEPFKGELQFGRPEGGRRKK